MQALQGSACLSENDVSALLGGALDAEARTRAQHHIDECSTCQELLACLLATASPAASDGAPQAKGPLGAGDTVGRYRIRSELGAGAMGVVYLADDRDLDRRAAVKVLQGQAADMSERLLREAQALARLSHPNVIVVYEVGTFGGQVFMAMEFVDGMSLTSWLGDAPRSVPEILSVFVQAGRGLAVAHAAGLVHRDFKPDNVLVGKDGRVRVVDFGLAREGAVLAHDRRPMATGHARELRNLTRTGAFVGTPAYMAPEQFEGLVADARTDQFGFCIALFEALFHRRPFEAETLDELAAAVRTGDVEVPRGARGARVTRGVEEAIVRGLRTRPDERFASMEALLAELEPRTRGNKTSRSALVALAAAITLGGSLSYVATRGTAVPSGASPAATTNAPSATHATEASSLASSASPPASASAPSVSVASVASPPSAPASASATASGRRRLVRPPTRPAATASAGPLMPTTP